MTTVRGTTMKVVAVVVADEAAADEAVVVVGVATTERTCSNTYTEQHQQPSKPLLTKSTNCHTTKTKTKQCRSATYELRMEFTQIKTYVTN